MPSNRNKYSQELREQTAIYVLESGKSATSVAEEMGIDHNKVCKWVREHRRKSNMPSYAEEKEQKKLKPKNVSNEKYRIKEQEREIKKLKKQLSDEREKVEILKKSLHIFMEQND
jgi:transposase-like protein